MSGKSAEGGYVKNDKKQSLKLLEQVENLGDIKVVQGEPKSRLIARTLIQ